MKQLYFLILQLLAVHLFSQSHLPDSSFNPTFDAWQNACPDSSAQTDRSNSAITDLPLPSTTPLVDNTVYFASQTVAGLESFYRLPVRTHSSLSAPEHPQNHALLYPQIP